MRVVVTPDFSDKRHPRVFGHVELFFWGNWLINILSFPKFTFPVEGGCCSGTLTLCEGRRLGLPLSRTVGRRFGNIQTMLLCRRLRRWHGTSCPNWKSALLGLLEFSDW